MPLLLVRHAHAGHRSSFDGDDHLRPLSPRGEAQALILVDLLTAHHPRRILSSPYVRCCETIRPAAEALGIPVESVGELAEGRAEDTVALLQRMAGESAVLCTHGDAALAVLEELAGSRPQKAKHAMRLLKGEVWVIQSTGSALVITDHLRSDGSSAFWE